MSSLCLAVATLALSQPIAPPNEDHRFKWWNEAKFGMFIHWGVYSVPADNTTKSGGRSIAEWHLSNQQLQISEYEKYAPQFNPVKFDARAWVRKAKDAGMKYIVITTKHHDGFALWPSKLTSWRVGAASPFTRDPLKELAQECKRQGIRLGFYHSIMDWHHPDYLPRRGWETRSASGADMNRYVDYMKGQIRELLTGYGPISVLWFDGGWERNEQDLRSKEVNQMIRELQPNILINDRNRLAEDFSTPEQTIPANALPNGRPWETCMTINDTWGFAKDDHNWKPTKTLVRNLIDIASKGGNFLLNVGPTAIGEFPPETDTRLAEVGQWLRKYGKAVYGSEKSPFKRPPSYGRVTRKGDSLFLHVFDWPANGELTIPGLKTPIRSARVLGGPSLSAEGATVVGVPAEKNPIATVVEVRLRGKLEVEDVPLGPDARGNLVLLPNDATLHGGLQVEDGNGTPNVGFWLKSTDSIEWNAQLPASGQFKVSLVYAAEPAAAGNEISVAGLPFTTVSTGSWQSYRMVDLGTVSLPSGNVKLNIQVKKMTTGAVINVRQLVLTKI